YFAAILGLAYLFFSRLGENLDNGALTIACLIISILSLVPFVYRINRNVKNYNVQFIENSRYRASSFIGISVGGILLTTIFLSGIYYIPFGQTMYGNSIWNKDIAYLKEQGLLSNNEKLEYLSTVELFSIKDSGSLFTNKRIISYWSDENTGKLNTEKLLLSDINRARLEEGADIWSQNLRITLKNNDEYLFELSIDDDIQNKVLKFINSQINNEVKVRVTYREN
ncbi:MAG: hypothetical protein GXP00_06325, partial [Alphaproteobacteria bacterium]|nr:hypothetical protein [Alphaproteobacteria bacterium]